MARAIRCPNCGAELYIKENRDFMFCEYCGTRVDLSDYRVIYQIIDEARIKESDNKKEVELKKIEIEHARIKKEELREFITDNQFFIFMIVMTVLFCVFMKII